MSINGSNKEAVFCWALLKYPNILKRALHLPLAKIELEKKVNGKDIDIYAMDKNRNLNVLVEVQLTKAHSTYVKRMKEMIALNPDSVLVWIASEFDESHIREMEDYINENARNVDFYAIEIDPNVLPILQELNELYKLEIYDELYRIREMGNVINVRYIKKQIPANFIGQASFAKVGFDFTKIEDVKRALLQELRERMPYLLNLYYNKKASNSNPALSVGAGLYGLSFKCGTRDKNGLSFVELYFDISKIDMYEKFKSLKNQMTERISRDIKIIDRKIGVYFEPSDTYEETFAIIAKLFERFLLFFSPYIFSVKEIKDEGIDVRKSFTDGDRGYGCRIMLNTMENHIETEDSIRIAVENEADYFLYK
ncbi:hypothetical protein [Alkalihalobacterium bogoriense]|uniref:hypothetical protein n=1 Tax=Alkalihalobacterium bogoriense TaxID=246272 RepID=UPI000685B6C8|nr:hypothetical protein [Alkalihalobacterium bogoriense]